MAGVSQALFDETVKENMGEFGLSEEEARRDAVLELRSQGASLRGVNTGLEEEEEEDSLQALVREIGAQNAPPLNCGDDIRARRCAEALKLMGRQPEGRRVALEFEGCFRALQRVASSNAVAPSTTLAAISACANLIADDENGIAGVKLEHSGALSILASRLSEGRGTEEDTIEIRHAVCVALANAAASSEHLRDAAAHAGAANAVAEAMSPFRHPRVRCTAARAATRLVESAPCRHQVLATHGVEYAISLCDDPGDDLCAAGLLLLSALLRNSSDDLTAVKDIMDRGGARSMFLALRRAPVFGTTGSDIDTVDNFLAGLRSVMTVVSNHEAVRELLLVQGIVGESARLLSMCFTTGVPIKPGDSPQWSPSEHILDAAIMVTSLLLLLAPFAHSLLGELNQEITTCGLVLADSIERCSSSIDHCIHEERDRGRQLSCENANIDSGRDMLVRFARVRLNSLSALAASASSEKRCLDLMLAGSREEGQLGPIIPRCLHIIRTMYQFDFEATRSAVNVVRNFCLPERTRIAIVNIGALPPLLSLVSSSRDPNAVAVAAAAIRILLGGITSQNPGNLVPQDALLLLHATLRTAPKISSAILTIQLEKLHPHARVELARALAALAQSLCRDAATATEEEATSDCRIPERVTLSELRTERGVCFIGFLLFSGHSTLVNEALQALLDLSPELFPSRSRFFQILGAGGSIACDKGPTFEDKLAELADSGIPLANELQKRLPR